MAPLGRAVPGSLATGLYQRTPAGLLVPIDVSSASDGDVVCWDPDLFGVGAGGYELRTPATSSASAATAGALGTVEISGTPTDPAHPVVYTKEATDALVAGVTGGASLTAKYTTWDPLVPDPSPHAQTDEFTASASLANWLLVNQSVAGSSIDVDTTGRGKLVITAPVSLYHQHAALKAIPAGDVGAVVCVDWIASNTDAAFTGLLLASSATAGAGSQIGAAVGRSSTGGGTLIRGALTWSGFGATASGAGLVGALLWETPRTLIAAWRVSGAWSIAWSSDGIVWAVHTISPAATPTHWGPFAQNYVSGGDTLMAAFDFFRVYAASTRPNPGALRTVYG